MIQRQVKVEAGWVFIAGHLAEWVDLGLVSKGETSNVHFFLTPAQACMVAGALQAAVTETPLDFTRGAILQNMPDLLNWTNGVLHQNAHAGDFLKAIATAAQRADNENFSILLPALLVLAEKYPQYLEQERARR